MIGVWSSRLWITNTEKLRGNVLSPLCLLSFQNSLLREKVLTKPIYRWRDGSTGGLSAVPRPVSGPGIQQDSRAHVLPPCEVFLQPFLCFIATCL